MDKLTATVIRRRLFVTLSVIITGLLVWADLDECLDTALVAYGIAIVLLTPVICVLIYRATRRHASDMYWIIILLCIGIDWAMISQFWARWVFVMHGTLLYADVLQSRFWALRNILEIYVFAYLAAWVAGRTFGLRDNGLQVIPDDREMALKEDMLRGFEKIGARITEGELRFAGHTHDAKGLVLEAKFVVQVSKEKAGD